MFTLQYPSHKIWNALSRLNFAYLSGNFSICNLIVNIVNNTTKSTKFPGTSKNVTVFCAVYWQSILHKLDNCLIDEYNANLSSKEKFSILRQHNINETVVPHLSMNSLRNRFDSLTGQITGNVDILMVSVTKLDESFPIDQFTIEDFGALCKVDRNANGAGIILFVWEDIPTKLLSVENSPTEAFFIEINLPKKKWLLSCFYNPNKKTQRITLKLWIKAWLYIHLVFFVLFCFAFYPGYFFTNIHVSQDCRKRGREFVKLLTTTSTRFADTQTLAGWLLWRAHLCI